MAIEVRSAPIRLKVPSFSRAGPLMISSIVPFGVVTTLVPRGARVATTPNGTLEEIVKGPARENDGTFNLMGALRTSMATCGYRDIAEFNRAELAVAPALQTEGKQLQREQGVGMGAKPTAAAVSVE